MRLHRAAPRVVRWTRANVRETLPDLPSRQTVSLFCGVLDRAARKVYGPLLAPPEELGEMAAAINGRLYFNLDQFARIASSVGLRPAAVMRGIGHVGDVAPEDERLHLPKLRSIPALLRLVRIANGVPRHVDRFLEHRSELLERTTHRDLGSASDADLAQMVASLGEECDAWVAVMFEIGSASTAFDSLSRLICWPARFNPSVLLFGHMAAGEPTVTAQLGFDLSRLIDLVRADEGARAFLVSGAPVGGFAAAAGPEVGAALHELLEVHGHRGIWETDISRPRYREDPGPILETLRRLVRLGRDAVPADLAARLQAEADGAWRAFAHAVPWFLRPVLLPCARKVLRGAKTAMLQRERMRSEFVRRIVWEFRRCSLEIAGRLVARGALETTDDYFLLDVDEVLAALADPTEAPGLSEIVEARRTEQEAFARIDMPLLMRTGEDPTGPAASPHDSSGELNGLCISRGCTENEVVVIDDPADLQAMRPDAILVAPATDPSWVPLFTLASGVIVEIGGVFSHAAIVARELGLPGLGNVEGATRLLRTGDLVHLDATNGLARVLRRAG